MIYYYVPASQTTRAYFAMETPFPFLISCSFCHCVLVTMYAAR